jgi:hypothetical protein
MTLSSPDELIEFAFWINIMGNDAVNAREILAKYQDIRASPFKNYMGCRNLEIDTVKFMLSSRVATAEGMLCNVKDDKVAKFLIDNGAIIDIYGNTPLINAYLEQPNDVVKVLRDHGAKLDDSQIKFIIKHLSGKVKVMKF